MQIRKTQLIFGDMSKAANRRPAGQQYIEGWTRRGFVGFARNSLITLSGFSLGLTKWGPRIAAAADTNQTLSRNKEYMEDSKIAARLLPQQIRETLSAVSKNGRLASLLFSAEEHHDQLVEGWHEYFGRRN